MEINEKVKFPKTTIFIPANPSSNHNPARNQSSNLASKESKESRQIKDFKSDINHLLDKNEEAIRGYISRYIYTSSISPETNQLLETIFKEIRNNITT